MTAPSTPASRQARSIAMIGAGYRLRPAAAEAVDQFGGKSVDLCAGRSGRDAAVRPRRTPRSAT